MSALAAGLAEVNRYRSGQGSGIGTYMYLNVLSLSLSLTPGIGDPFPLLRRFVSIESRTMVMFFVESSCCI